MITRITGTLARLGDTEAWLDVGPFEYEVFIPEFVRRQLQANVGQTVSLKTIEYIEGNPTQGRLTPRMVGFLSDAEVEFFEAVCSVDGMGVKKSLRAMVRPVRDVAAAIEEQDIKQLSLLPGIGPAMAERIIAKLRRKMAKFALMIARDFPAEPAAERTVLNDAFDALLSLGYNAVDAQSKLDAVCRGKQKFKTVEDVILAIYQLGRA
ncbi:MAG TPA: Holliday junction branch migration protein RuvA [Planctomycetaceae bacterium]|nr:Holliday junction branch migration protein RuvA [Planctomycetaceae bacterium]